jgi:hypothetical protein
MAAASMAAALTGCGSSHHNAPAVLPIAEVNGRYRVAVDPANAALAAVLKRVLAYSGGPTTAMDATIAPASATLQKAAGQVRPIGAAGLLRHDILDVADTLNLVAGDLTSLRSAQGDSVQPSIARLVADAGRESAADNLVRLVITELTTPTTAPPPTLEPPTLPTTTTSTTLGRHTATTRGRTTTTRRAPTSSTSKP